MRTTKIEIGRIDLTNNCSFFEVPSEDAELVMNKMKRAKVGERKVVVDHAEREDGTPNSASAARKERKDRRQSKGRTYAEAADPQQLKQGWKAEKKGRKPAKKQKEYDVPRKAKKDDWKQFFED